VSLGSSVVTYRRVPLCSVGSFHRCCTDSFGFPCPAIVIRPYRPLTGGGASSGYDGARGNHRGCLRAALCQAVAGAARVHGRIPTSPATRWQRPSRKPSPTGQSSGHPPTGCGRPRSLSHAAATRANAEASANEASFLRCVTLVPSPIGRPLLARSHPEPDHHGRGSQTGSIWMDFTIWIRSARSCFVV
jgi:hypothetical protein